MKENTPDPTHRPTSDPHHGAARKAIKIGNKITLLGFSMVALTVVILTAIVFVQKSRLAPVLSTYLDQQAFDEADKLVRTVRDQCAAAEAEGARQLDHSLNLARELLLANGAVSPGSDKVEWDAENQFTHQKSRLT